MLLTRVFDDRMHRAQRQGKITFYIKSTGEEAVSVAQCMALRPATCCFRRIAIRACRSCAGASSSTSCVSCCRTRAICARGGSCPSCITGAKAICFRSREISQRSFRKPSAGRWRRRSRTRITSRRRWIGDGSTAEADFHYALLFAQIYRAPVLLNVVNNQWAISTFQTFAGGEGRSFAARGPGYGIPGIRVDGNDFLAVYSVTQWAAERARNGHGPTLIELVTYRAAPHSTSDDPSRYRPKDDHERWPLGDPIERLKSHLIALGEWSEEREKRSC